MKNGTQCEIIFRKPDLLCNGISATSVYMHSNISAHNMN